MKMRILYVLIGILCLPFTVQAQLFGYRTSIDLDVGVSYGFTPGDFDNDGDPDLLRLSFTELVWYENMDGEGTYGEPTIIDNISDQSLNQLVVDLDGDNKQDFLVSFFGQDLIAFYRNLGNGSFAPMEILASGLNSVRGIAAGDVDGDNDLDLVLGVTNGLGFYWIEHLDGNGTFGPLIPIDNTLSQARTQRLADVDGDNDLDIVTNAVGGTIMAWFENTDGKGNFSVQHSIANSGLYENDFDLVDLDGDDDLDILTLAADKAFWRENTNGQGDFSEQQTFYVNTVSGFSISGLQAIDLDKDGDIDACYNAPQQGIAYNLNDGTGLFGPTVLLEPHINTDLDRVEGNMDANGDGDLDLLNIIRFQGANDRYDLQWIRNLTFLDGVDFQKKGLQLTPNPVGDLLRIQSQEPLQQATFYDVLGQSIMTVHKDFEAIPVSTLPTGLYFVEVRTAKGAVVKRVVKE